MKKFAITLVIIASTVILASIAFSDNQHSTKLQEGSHTTYVEAKSEDKKVSQKPFEKDRTINEQILESSIIVKGKVVEIIEVVETTDLIETGLAEAAEIGYKFIHTNVLFEVKEYFGKNKLPYDNIVIRHIGGRIEESVHVFESEALTVGEEIILFRLHQPLEMTQVPTGFVKEQYFLFQPMSKYIQVSARDFQPDFKRGDRVRLSQLKEQIQQIQAVR